jgi:hypothetical protein
MYLGVYLYMCMNAHVCVHVYMYILSMCMHTSVHVHL